MTHYDLSIALRDAHQEILDLRLRLAEYEWVETAPQKRTQELGERVKELECLYAISRCLCHSEAVLPQMLQDIVKILPSGYQNPKLTWAQLDIAGESVISPQFRITPDSHAADIFILGRRAGALRVYVLAKSSPDGDPSNSSHGKGLAANRGLMGRKDSRTFT